MEICVDGACDPGGCSSVVVCPACGSFVSGCLVVAEDVGIGSTCAISTSTAVDIDIGMGICLDGACDPGSCSGAGVCLGCGSFTSGDAKASTVAGSAKASGVIDCGGVTGVGSRSWTTGVVSGVGMVVT